MTPFGLRVRELRKARGMSLKQMAADMGVSAAYFSALEHGHRSRPGPGLVLEIAGYFQLDGDGTEELKKLAALSHPRVVIDTAGLSPQATVLANLLANEINKLDEETIDWVINEIRGRQTSLKGPVY